MFIATLPVPGIRSNLTELAQSRCFAYAMPELPMLATHSDMIFDFLNPVLWQNRFGACFQIQPDIHNHPEKEYALLSGLAAGMRGWEAVSPAGAGAFPGFLTDRQGTPRHVYPPFWESIKEHVRVEGFMNSQLHADVLLITLPDYERAKYLETPAWPRYDLIGIEGIGFDPAPWDPETRAYLEGLKKLENFLTTGQYAFLKAEGSKNGLDRLTASHLLMVPSQEKMSAALQALLCDILEGGKLHHTGGNPAHAPGERRAHVLAGTGRRQAQNQAENFRTAV